MESREFGLDGIGLEYPFVGESDILEVLLVRDCVGDSFSFSSFLFLGLINLLLRRRGMEIYIRRNISIIRNLFRFIYLFIHLLYNRFILGSLYGTNKWILL